MDSPIRHGHYKSESVVIKDNDIRNATTILTEEMLNDIREENESKNDEVFDEDDDLKRALREYDDGHDEDEEDQEEEDENGYNEEKDPFKLPFEDIDVMANDLTWLDTDELVPISRKEMLDANEISKLKIKDKPDYDVIRSDGLEQREREKAVDKLEKSYMADAALKKAKEKEKEEMQKR